MKVPRDLAEIDAFPRYLMYDVNNVCNAACPFCPQSSIATSDDFSPLHLEWTVFEKTIEEAARHNVDLVRFTGDGEPLLHPRITDMIKYARELGLAKINLTTNGSLLRGERLEKILASPPHIIDFSIDALTPETYAKYRVGLHFDVTMENIKNFLKRRDPAQTYVIVSMIAHPGLEDEVQEFEAYWSKRVDQVAIRRLHSNLGAVEVAQEPLPDPRWPCPHLWQRLVVDFRGHIRFCPVDWFDETSLGSVADMSIAEAWHSLELTTLRQKHAQGDYDGCGTCEKCGDWANTVWQHSWLDMVQKAVQS